MLRNERSGCLHVNGIYLDLTMSIVEQATGPCLNVLYMYAKPSPDAVWADRTACGTGLGTRVMLALREWCDQTETALRFTLIVNPAFFERFDFWTQTDFARASGECCYLPPMLAVAS